MDYASASLFVALLGIILLLYRMIGRLERDLDSMIGSLERDLDSKTYQLLGHGQKLIDLKRSLAKICKGTVDFAKNTKFECIDKQCRLTPLRDMVECRGRLGGICDMVMNNPGINTNETNDDSEKLVERLGIKQIIQEEISNIIDKMKFEKQSCEHSFPDSWERFYESGKIAICGRYIFRADPEKIRKVILDLQKKLQKEKRLEEDPYLIIARNICNYVFRKYGDQLTAP